MTISKLTRLGAKVEPTFNKGDLVVYGENRPEARYIVLVTGSNPNWSDRFTGVIIYAGENRFAELGKHGVDFEKRSFSPFHGEISLSSR